MPIPVELKLLTLSTLLGFVHIVSASHAASVQRGYRWAAGARDEPVPPLPGVAGRLARASQNFLETFPFFAAAVLMAQAMGTHSALTVWGAWLYFCARLVYFPLYVAGVWLLRSLVWDVAVVGIALLAIAPFLS